MIGAKASGAPHAHQEDQPMTEARLFSDDKFNAIWTVGWSTFEVAEARWVSELDMAGPLWAIFGAFHTPPRDKDYVGKISVSCGQILLIRLTPMAMRVPISTWIILDHLDPWLAFRGPFPGQAASFDPYLGAVSARARGIPRAQRRVAYLAMISCWSAADQLLFAPDLSGSHRVWRGRRGLSWPHGCCKEAVCRRCTWKEGWCTWAAWRWIAPLMSWVESKKTLKTKCMSCALISCGNQESLVTNDSNSTSQNDLQRSAVTFVFHWKTWKLRWLQLRPWLRWQPSNEK